MQDITRTCIFALSSGEQLDYLQELMKEVRQARTVTIKQLQEEFTRRDVIIAEDDYEGDEEGGAAKCSPIKRKQEGSKTWVTKVMAVYTRLADVEGLVALLRTNELSSSQEGRSWCGKRKPLELVAKTCKSVTELDFVFKGLLEDIDTNRDHAASHLARRAAVLLFRLRLVMRLREDFKVTDDGDAANEINAVVQDDAWTSIATFNKRFSSGADMTEIYELPSKGSTLFHLMKAVLLGEHDDAIASVDPAQNFEKSVSKVEIANLMADLVQAWESSASTLTDETPHSGSASQPAFTTENHAAIGSTTANPKPDTSKNDAEALASFYNDIVEKELATWFHGVSHTGTAEGDIQLLSKTRAVCGGIKEGRTRVWQIETAQHVELHEKFGRSNPFFPKHCGGIPPIDKDMNDIWIELIAYFVKADDAQNIVWWASNGSATNEKLFQTLQKKVRMYEDTPWTFASSASDLISRQQFSLTEEPHRKRLRIGCLEELAIDRIHLASNVKLDLPEPQTKHLPGVSWSFHGGYMCPVPLLPSGSMLRVYLDEKQHVMQGPGKVSMRGASAGKAQAEGFKSSEIGNKVILFHTDRSPLTYAEMDNILNVERKIIFTGGNGTSIMGSIMNKTRCVAVFRNQYHHDLVRVALKEWLLGCVQDPANARFYRPLTEEALPASPGGATAVPMSPGARTVAPQSPGARTAASYSPGGRTETVA